ncbi:MAG: thiamine diphosphokinase [Nitriliruptoraceae bacterium]|nr:thiamine diphosphokinase [Nitriliruptoraceae bacterium]
MPSPRAHDPADAEARPHVVVLVGGAPVRAPLPVAVDDADVVIAADGGAAHAEALGFDIDLLVGDLDSITPADHERLTAAGVRVERSPTDKDATDLELALEAAHRHAPARCTLIGGAGGRLDHLLGNVHVFADPRHAALRLVAVMPPAVVHVIHDHDRIVVHPGETLSLLATHGDAHGVTLRGARWPLHGETLPAGSSRGISNLADGAALEISVERGTLVLVRPDPAGSSAAGVGQ